MSFIEFPFIPWVITTVCRNAFHGHFVKVNNSSICEIRTLSAWFGFCVCYKLSLEPFLPNVEIPRSNIVLSNAKEHIR